MAQIRVEPKSSFKWPYLAVAIILFAAIWLLLSRNVDPTTTASTMRDSTVRDSLAGTIVTPPDTSHMLRDSVTPPLSPSTPRR